MSTEQPASIPHQIQEIPEWLRKWGGLLLAERGAHLDNLQRQRANVFNLAQRAQNQAYGKDVDEGIIQMAETDEDMGVRVGDNTVSHNYYPSPPGGNQPSTLGTVGTVAAAALLGAAGATFLPAWMAGKGDSLGGDPAVVEPAPDGSSGVEIGPDKDTVIDWKIYRPK